MDVSFFGFLTSRRFVSVLLGLFILLMALGTLIPQEHLCEPQVLTAWQESSPRIAKIALAAGGTRLYTSLPFVTVAGLLMLSTAVCTVQRVRQLWGERRPISLDSLSPLETSLGLVEKEAAGTVERVQQQLHRGGYRICRAPLPEGVRLLARKGEAGRWGSALFHFSFLVLLVGTLASVWTRSEGSFILTEGQTFTGTPAEFIAWQGAPLPWAGRGELNLTLERFVPEFGQPPTYTSEVMFSAGDGEPNHQTVSTFRSASYAGRTFYQKDHGFSPRFVVKTDRGHTLFDGFVALVSNLSEATVRYENIFAVSAAGLQIEGQLFPDAEEYKGTLRSRSPQPNRPVFSARIERMGQNVFDGAIPLGETLTLQDLQITFIELRYWSGLQMVTDAGVPILYAGFFLGLLGLGLRTFIGEETLWLQTTQTPQGDVLVFAGAAEKDQTLFSEKFQSLADELKSSLI
ncbi:MAG: cytochrome c biogenesis protein ResB, partial [Desulfuromonadales bacterium]|nr:cytochrome c biogenesis protein ResB [Desulfuromonadales bacterium]